jgi:alanyl-tRNA synthetase
MLTISPESIELCGGTHVTRTGDIGLFKILSESGVAAGVRRIEAITGDNALRWVQQTADTLQRAAGMIKTQPADLVERLGLLQLQMRSLERDLDQLKSKLAASAGNDLLDKAIVLNGEAKLLVANMAGTDPKALRGMVDQLKDRLKSAVVLLSTVADDKISLVGGVTSDLVGKVKAGDLVAMVASQVGGKGGGRPDMAMGGGTNVAALPGATSSVESWVRERLQ